MLRYIRFLFHSWRAERAHKAALRYMDRPAGSGWSCATQISLDKRAQRLAYRAGTYA